jgi:hypothetical protein
MVKKRPTDDVKYVKLASHQLVSNKLFLLINLEDLLSKE